MPETQGEAPDSLAGVAGAVATDDKPAPPAADKPAPPAAVEPAAQPVSPPSARPAQRNPIFAELVQGEDDLAGLVGYALYKLNKRDWLASFFKTHGRDPTEGEVASYILGERTQRRLATYRHLADDVIGRKAPITERSAPGAATTAATPPPQRISAMKGTSLRSSLATETVATRPHRSAMPMLMFWIVVLIVLTGAGYVYVNYPWLLPSR
jgi:hypothetical protein